MSLSRAIVREFFRNGSVIRCDRKTGTRVSSDVRDKERGLISRKTVFRLNENFTANQRERYRMTDAVCR